MEHSEHNQRIIDSITHGIIPNVTPVFKLNDAHESLHMRNEIALKNGMWLYVDQAYAKRLAKWLDGRSILDPMAGRGWLAKALRKEGIKVNASDLQPNGWRKNCPYEPVTNVKTKDIKDAIKESKEDVMILSWVPYGFDVTEESSLWGQDRPILFLGELGDCCSTYRYANIVQNLKTFKYERALEPYNWYGIHDSAFSYMWNDQTMELFLKEKEQY